MSRARLGLGLLSLIAGVGAGWLAGLLKAPRAQDARQARS